MKELAMEETNHKDDPLTRIQREIIEVTEREKEFKEGHFAINRKYSESILEVGHLANGTPNGNVKALSRAVSTSQLLGPGALSATTTPPQANGGAGVRRFTPNAQKGIMQRFIASKGKLTLTTINTSPISPAALTPLKSAPAHVTSPPVFGRNSDAKPMRKGFIPVEEKIQKELREMKDREMELKRMRKRNQSHGDLSSLDISDEELDSDSEDEIPPPGKLKPTKSIGELYESFGDGRSPSPRNSSGYESYTSIKPAKSLAELCDLAPDEEFLAPSSTKLIAQWESLIQQKQETGAA